MAKILVIDDDPSIVELIKTVLKIKGHKVFVGRNAQQGLRLMLKEEPDVAIIDYMMPGRDGLKLLNDIRSVQELKLVPIIMLTGNGEPEVVSKAIQLGITDFVKKPVKIQALLERLDKILVNIKD